jgi:hypothetical protein
MLKIFIILVFLLLIYQFFGQILEGLEGESDGGTDGGSDGTTSNNNCGMSLTDRNVFLLNDRVNTLQTQYTDLSGNIAIINRQLEDLMKQNENQASEMVGDKPLDVASGGEDIPESFGDDTEE